MTKSMLIAAYKTDALLCMSKRTISAISATAAILFIAHAIFFCQPLEVYGSGQSHPHHIAGECKKRYGGSLSS
jgi:hypothetical protein